MMHTSRPVPPPPSRQPPPLPLSQTEDGSLATAPLGTVINAATNELYQDLYNLIHGEIPIASSSATDDVPAAGAARSPGKDESSLTTSHVTNNSNEAVTKRRMSALSFAQRRHELTRRLVLHSKSISHVYALAASSLPNSHSALLRSTSSFPRLGATVSAGSDALRFVRNAWQSADEAQDALYFHHDGLWRSRAHVHDVLGALCVLCGGYWPDFPGDVALAVDRYENSKEKGYGVEELRERLAAGVRRKLVLGEVGEFGVGRASNSNDTDLSLRDRDPGRPLPWKVTMEPGGGAIRLTYGAPRIVSTAEALRLQSIHNSQQKDVHTDMLQVYPIEARLSVLSELPNAPWKLLSLHVHCSPKTGESDHQLRMNKKQMFDLHRIGERVMIVEEAICKRDNSERIHDAIPTDKPTIVSRPLLRLFEVVHSFALSTQLEMLSSQAEALRRGAWGGFVGIPTTGTMAKEEVSLGDGIAVSPAYFFDETKTMDDTSTIGVIAVHFWSCDDRYGSPRVGDLSPYNHDDSTATTTAEGVDTIETVSSPASTSYSRVDRRVDDNYLPVSDNRGEKRLSLCIRAVPMVGLVVSLSGGSNVSFSSDKSQQDHHMKRNIDKLLSSIQDPFQLSMSDALLAATVLCAQRRCRSVVDALNRQISNRVPSWIHLEVECGSISIAARISYSSATSNDTQSIRPYVVLFRLACDSRTGRFIPVFPRPVTLLRLLACHDVSSSDTQALRSVAMTNAMHLAGKNSDGLTREATGRIVRNAFDTLSRSMDTLGRKCGVGGEWNDIDKQSASLREKSVDQSCRDVVVSLGTCCGIAAVFGIGAIALKIVCGIDPVADNAGGPIQDDTQSDMLNVPPLSVLLSQRIVEQIAKATDGETKRIQHLEGEVFALTAKVNDDRIEMLCYDALTILDSPCSVPRRIKFASVHPDNIIKSNVSLAEPPSKKPRIELKNNTFCHHISDEVQHAVTWFDAMFRQ